MQSIISSLLLLCFSLMGGACLPESESGQQAQQTSITSEPAVPAGQNDDFPYDLLTPDKRIALPPELVEASAVCVLNEDELGLVQDERGRIYIYSQSTQAVTHICDFRPGGDFEGLSMVGDTAYALRSDGRIYMLVDYRQESVEAQSYQTFLQEEDDVEGLTYDAATHSLLLACKEPPLLGSERRKDKRAIYRFDLASQQLQKNTFLLLDMNQIARVLQAQARTAEEKAFAAAFDPEKKSSFKPSDLAVHPRSGEIYTIASNGELLVVSDRDGNILYVRQLPRKIYSQPEGIHFAADGTLYISNEGRDAEASVLRFNPRF